MGFFVSFFKRSRRQPVPDEPIPRYPPFARGLPAVSPERLLADHKDLIDAIRMAVGLRDREFGRLVAPTIRRYAAFVHLLPASERHHHRGAGGLLFHGLEVAHWTVRSSEDVVFAHNATPRERRELEPRWRLAAFFAGLLHDAGKPVSDLSVTDQNGGKRWNPFVEDIETWAGREKIERYYIHWRRGRGRAHERYSALVMERMLSPEVLRWFGEQDPEILDAMLGCVGSGAQEPGNVLSPLVLSADNASVSRDLKRNASGEDPQWGVPVERYILDTARRLLASGEWRPNQPGSPVWRLHEGLFVVWHRAAEDIRRTLLRDGVPGIPFDPDTLADILLERDLAQACTTGGQIYRYWLIQPEGVSKPLRALKLQSPELLFNEPPPAVAGRAGAIEEGMKHETDSASSGAEAPAALAAEPSELSSSPEEAGSSSPEEAGMEALPDGQTKLVKRKRKAESRFRSEPQVMTPGPGAPPPEDMAGDGVSTQRQHQEGGGLVKLHEKPAAHAARDVDHERPVPAAEKTAEKAREPESNNGEPAMAAVLDAIAVAAEWGGTCHQRGGHVVVSYPDGLAPAGEPAEVLRALDAAGHVAVDPLAPMKKVRRLDGVTGVVLTRQASERLLAASTMSSPKEELRNGAGNAGTDGAGGQELTGVVEELIAAIHREDKRIPGGVLRRGDSICISQAAIGWFGSQHDIPLGALRAAIEAHPAIEMRGKTQICIRPIEANRKRQTIQAVIKDLSNG